MRKAFLKISFLFYRYFISPVLHTAFTGGCRFTPSCSQYAEEAFANKPLFTALKLTTIRILRCHPWTPMQYDPVHGNTKEG